MVAPPHYKANSTSTILTFSNLPNNSFTSILLSSYRPVASLRCRCEGAYEVFTDVQGRALRFGGKSSLRCEVFFVKTLYVLTSTPKSPWNETTDATERRIKKCRINERQIRIRNSLPRLSNPHQIEKRRSKMKAVLKIAFWVVLAMFVSSMFGGSLWAWSIGLWLCKEVVLGIIRFLFGCIIFLLSAVAFFGFLFWLLTL